jgi:hypothetical protein
MKPRTAPHGGKPHTAPEHNHTVMSQAEQAKFLGRGDEVVSNLGHPSREDDLTRHPLGKVDDYANNRASERVVDGPKRSVGVYRSFKNPESGIPNQQNLDRWAGYAQANSYTGHGNKAGPGKEPPQSDGQRRSVPSEARDKDSDGYLADPKEWSRFDRGSESGEGRLEKIHRK